MAKKTKKTKEEDDDIEMDDMDASDDDLDLDEPEVISEDDQADDDTAYTMGDIVVDDGSSDEADEDERILQSAPTAPASEEEDNEDVWVDDVDVFNDDDPYLADEGFDPDNADGYYD
ncbi:hypothetical protein KC678_05435 [Candidatus Dojkabacteria bacterium]|uniref:Uncharacterized protein n=1 Tax=Candidatus Dojkabacteria bacterium TaxID=2099670 RepID=A0A955L2G7_9BACT|nr:hypothetical protein [Candidatus Dojkabacteria bacterium]